MFIFDFVAETILDQILDWIYGKIIGFLNDFFVMMNNMGVELFALPWVEAVITFFSYFGWALFGCAYPCKEPSVRRLRALPMRKALV